MTECRLELRAAAGVRDDGELQGPGGGDGGGGVAAHRLHAGRRGVGDGEPGAVPPPGLHRDLLRRRHPGLAWHPQARRTMHELRAHSIN